MRVLHLYSDHRWTGPAEPVLQLCAQLQRMGLDARFACRATPGVQQALPEREVGTVQPVYSPLSKGVRGLFSPSLGQDMNTPLSPLDRGDGVPPQRDDGGTERLRRDIASGSFHQRSLAEHAERMGINSITHFHLNRYFDALENLQDVRLIRRWIDREGVDIIHTHLTHDHFIGGLAARLSARKPRIVRTNHKGIALPLHFGNRLLLDYFTDGYVSFTKVGIERDRLTFNLDPSRTLQIDPAVDLERFRSTADAAVARTRLGIPEQAIVAGIVARMQRHRRFDVLLKAFQAAVREEPNLRLLIVGRGTHRRKVAIEPAKRLGLENHVIFAGYRTADFVETLAAIDFKIFLVPGSDGTCRALREAMAMGKPSIVAHRGMLPELVIDGVTGLVIEDTEEKLAEAILRLAHDKELRDKLGRNAGTEAGKRFDLAAQARVIAQFYSEIVTL